MMRLSDWILALGGLGVFLFSLRFLTDVLNRSISRRFRPLLGRVLTSPLRGIALGAGTTLVAQASSITIIASMGLLANALITFEQGFYMMLGATLGTTLKAWFFAENLDAAGPLLVGVTSVALIFVRHPLGREICGALLSIGFTFLGLEMLARGLGPLAHDPAVAGMLRLFDGHSMGSQVLGLLMGCSLAMAVQSSSTIVFLVIDLASHGLISLPAGAALILGANVGTTVTPLLASLEYGRDVKRLALSHVFVKASGAIVAVLLFPAFLGLTVAAVALLPVEGSPSVQLAAVHTGFNVLNVAGWGLAGPLMIAFVSWLVPTKQEGPSLLPPIVRKMLVNAPARALQEVDSQVAALTRMGKALTDECLDALSDPGAGAKKSAYARQDFEQAKDGAYEILMALARSKQLDAAIAARVRHQLRFVSICAQVSHQALELRTHLERGVQVDRFELPPGFAQGVEPVRHVFDQLWLAIFFEASHEVEGVERDRSGAESSLSVLDEAYFTFLRGADYRETDLSHWSLDAITRLRQLLDALQMLRSVAHEHVPNTGVTA